MALYLGIDTSNYTTSAALFDSGSGNVIQRKTPLAVREGQIGLRQSDAMFGHVKQLGPVLRELIPLATGPLAAVGVSVSPRDEAGSYMPCFLAGKCAAESAAAALGIPLHGFSHQAGHIAAAIHSAAEPKLFLKPFLAFHISGGTTQCLLVVPDKDNCFTIETVAETLDLNAGQLIDRVGAMLGIGFPAGPVLEELAACSEREFRPKIAFKGNNCCLSGAENQCRDLLDGGASAPDVARFCLECVREALFGMTRAVMKQYPGYERVYAGGVMSNRFLRESVAEEFGGFFAEPAFSADNAAGIAILCSRREERP